MKAILIPVILLAAGTCAGLGAGVMLAKPAAEVVETAAHDTTDAHEAEQTTDREYAKLNNQFVVPVVEDGKVTALVVLALNLEVIAGKRPEIFALEPKLRDGFLQALFNYANIGGFSGNFTAPTNLQTLRRDLLGVAQRIAGPIVTDVLLLDFVRQDA